MLKEVGEDLNGLNHTISATRLKGSYLSLDRC